MVTVPSYGYAEAKPVKCEKPCSIENKPNGSFILRNEYLSAEIDNLGRIIALTLNGDERYSTWIAYHHIKEKLYWINIHLSWSMIHVLF